MNRAWTSYSAPLIQKLTAGLPFLVSADNVLRGTEPDEKIAELIVQGCMVQLLAPHLPNSEHVIQNKEIVVTDTSLGGCVPDIIIKNVGDGYWGFIELKTLFNGGSLCVADVNRDLDKLCAYKIAFPEAAAIFALTGSRKKLFNPQRDAAWKTSRIVYAKHAFATTKLSPQKLNEHFVAIPCGSSSPEMDVQVFFWEILPRSDSTYALTTSFRFDACMSDQ